jgi:hypothetical protein
MNDMYRKYKVNEDFFNIWSHDMSYCLGFLMADGNVKLQKGQPSILRASLNIQDKDVLEFIRYCIGPSLPLKTSIRRNTAGTYSEVCSLNICSKDIAVSVMKLGIVPRKTGKEYIPNIPWEYLPTFLRGYFDGDGNIYVGTVRQYTQYHFSIFSSLQMCIDWYTLFQFGSIKRCGKADGGCVAYTTSNWKEIMLIYDYIYSTKSHYLKRKKSKFHDIAAFGDPQNRMNKKSRDPVTGRYKRVLI